MLTLRRCILVLFVAFGYRSLLKYLGGCECKQEGRLDGLVALVTSAESSLGLATTRGLARRGATVVMTCSVVEACNKARIKLLEEFGRDPSATKHTDVGEGRSREDGVKDVGYILPERLFVRRLHISSAASVAKFCQQFSAEFKKLNILIVSSVHLGLTYDKTVEGFERNLGHNYLTGFILSQRLLKLLGASAKPGFPSRIIFVSTSLHKYGSLPTTLVLNKPEKEFSWWREYTGSQLATLVYADYLNREIQHTNVSITVVNPGIVDSLVKSIFYWPLNIIVARFTKSPWQAAQTIISTALNRTIGSNIYFEECQAADTTIPLKEEKAGAKLFQMTLHALKPYME